MRNPKTLNWTYRCAPGDCLCFDGSTTNVTSVLKNLLIENIDRTHMYHQARQGIYVIS